MNIFFTANKDVTRSTAASVIQLDISYLETFPAVCVLTKKNPFIHVKSEDFHP